MLKQSRWIVGVFVCLLALPACGGVMRNATRPLVDNLSAAILKQSDPELVRDGAPAYLLLIDGMVEGAPDDDETLLAAAKLYSAYTSGFVTGQDPERAALLAGRARDYAFRAAAIRKPRFGALHDKPYAQFETVARDFVAGDEELLFTLVSTWAGVIAAEAGNFDRLADIAKVELLTRRLLELDETYYYGAPHLALGLLNSLLPPSLGGKPDAAREHFEKALAIGGGKFLPAHVMYAENYAKKTFDKPLFVKLLNHVLATPPDVVPELTLVNTLARRQAQALMAGADEYFD